MSQKYLIGFLSEEEPDKIIVVLTNYYFDNSANRNSIISAGTVRFIKGMINAEADVTHGNIGMGIPVDLERAKIDKKLIEELFT